MEPWMAFLGVFVLGVAHIVYNDFLSQNARVKRWLARTSRVRIADAHDGVVRVTGKVRLLSETLRAPVTGRPCAAYHLKIEIPEGDGPWEPVLELADARPFALADESGEGLVDTAAGPFTLVLLPDRRGSTGVLRGTTADLRAARSLLEAHGVSTTTWTGKPRRFRFTESILTGGSQVSVGGCATKEVAADGERANYREPPERVVVRSGPDQPLLISNWREARGHLEK